jgi:antitoxin (DNA-binding transcriptional repressor) of toxin-antitoxin stability system
MSVNYSIEEVQSNFRALIERLEPGNEIVITDNQQPIAKIISSRSSATPPPAPGLGKGSVLYMAPDFDAPMW